MPSVSTSLSPLQRDLVVGAVAVVLVATPFWIGSFGLDEPVTTYERAAITTDDETLEYEERAVSPFGPVPISEDIACSAGTIDEIRTCSLEAQLTGNDTVSTDIRTSSDTFSPFSEEYQYVRVDGAVYEAIYPTGDGPNSTTNSVAIGLEQADPDAVLEDISIAADRSDIPDVVREAVESGEAETRGSVDLPQSPIETDDGEYYRVYQVGLKQPSQTDETIESLARFGGPIVGLLILYSLSHRLTYVDGVKRE